MAGFYKKDLDVSGLSKLVPAMSKSPLESLGKSMSQLDSILTNRDKEQYTKTALEGLGGAANTTEYLKGLQGLDPTRLTKIGATSAQQNFVNLSALENIQAEQAKAKATAEKNLFDQQMQTKEYKLKKEDQKRKQEETGINEDKLGLEQLEFESEQNQLEAKEKVERQTGDYLSGVQSLLSVDRDKYGEQIPLALSSLRDAYPEADVTKASDTVETLFKKDTDSKQYVKDYNSLTPTEKMELKAKYNVNNASEYNEYTQEKFKTPPAKEAQQKAEGEFKASLNQNKLLKDKIKNVTTEKLFDVTDPDKIRELNDVFNSAKNAGMNLIDAKDEEKLSNVENMANNFQILMSSESKDVTGIADKIVSDLSAVTGLGDAKENAKVKSALGETLFNIARNWNGPGVLSKTDVDMARVGAGNLWLSDKDLAGKLAKSIETTIINLEKARSNAGTNREYFDLRYGSVYEVLKVMRDGIKSSKNQVKKNKEVKNIDSISQLEVQSMTPQQRQELINKTLKGL